MGADLSKPLPPEVPDWKTLTPNSPEWENALKEYLDAVVQFQEALKIFKNSAEKIDTNPKTFAANLRLFGASCEKRQNPPPPTSSSEHYHFKSKHPYQSALNAKLNRIHLLSKVKGKKKKVSFAERMREDLRTFRLKDYRNLPFRMNVPNPNPAKASASESSSPAGNPAEETLTRPNGNPVDPKPNPHDADASPAYLYTISFAHGFSLSSLLPGLKITAHETTSFETRTGSLVMMEVQRFFLHIELPADSNSNSELRAVIDPVRNTIFLTTVILPQKMEEGEELHSEIHVPANFPLKTRKIEIIDNLEDSRSILIGFDLQKEKDKDKLDNDKNSMFS